MSYAIRIFMAEQFSEKPYREFIADIQNLFGKWSVTESTPFYDTGWIIHECRLESEGLPQDEWVGVWVSARRRLREEKPMWPFDYEWYTGFETGTGRTPLGLAVQLGALVLAMRKFPWVLVEDRDADIDDGEPTEFRSEEAVLAHLKRVLGRHPEGCEKLRRRGILDLNGSLLLP
jgi:hypothetical protein